MVSLLLILLIVVCDLHFCVTQVMQFLEVQDYSMFSRIVFDTAPTVITLPLFIKF